MKNETKKFIESLPNTAFYGWEGFKSHLRRYLKLPENKMFDASEFIEIFKKQAKKRKV